MAYQFRGKVDMNKAIDKAKGGIPIDPTRFAYKLNDKGVFTAVLRLLPAPDVEEGFVRTDWHKVKDRSGRDINLACPKMIRGQPCPICGYVTSLFNIGSEESKKIGSKYNSSKTYYTNALVKTNVSAPESVGKVLILAYKAEINKIITAALVGDPDAGIAPINPFDYFNGADFVFRAVQKGEWPTYVNSKFEGVTSLGDELAQFCDEHIHELMKFRTEAIAKIKPLGEILEIFRKATGTDISAYVDSRLVSNDAPRSEATNADDLGTDEAPAEEAVAEEVIEDAVIEEVPPPPPPPPATASKPKATTTKAPTPPATTEAPKATGTAPATKAPATNSESPKGKADKNFWAGFDAE